jgi:hypothetical protein
MKKRLLWALLSWLSLLSFGARAQTNVLLAQENFEGGPAGTNPTYGYTANSFQVTSNNQYFQRQQLGTGAPAYPGTSQQVTNQEGSYAWTAEGVRGTGTQTVRSSGYVVLNSVNTTGYKNFSMTVAFADPSGTSCGTCSRNAVLSSDRVRLQYSFDGGPFVTAGLLTNSSSGYWQQDTSTPLDSVADGTVIDQDFRNITARISGTGSALRVRVVCDFRSPILVFDNIRVYGDVNAVATPTLNGLETTAASYTEGGGPVQLTNSLTVGYSDNTSPNLTGGKVNLSANFASGDQLNFSNQNGITGSYNTGNGVLTLTGTASLATYQTALRSITYSNTNATTLNTGTRQITFQVENGSTVSNNPVRTLNITGVLNAAAALNYTEDFNTNGDGTRYFGNTWADVSNVRVGSFRATTSPAVYNGTQIGDATFTGWSGGYWFGESPSTSLNPTNPYSVVQLAPVNATGRSNIRFTVAIGAAGPWLGYFNANNPGDQFELFYSTDGGTTLTKFGAFYGVDGTTPARQDADIDPQTPAAGTLLGTALQDFTFNLPASAAVGNLTFVLRQRSRAGGIELAYDNIRITADVAPTVATGTTGIITSSTASISNNSLTADGGASITDYGVVYVAGTGTPTTSNTKVQVGTSSPTTFPSNFSANLTGLTAGTQYTVRAYATNSVGTSYGANVTFTTAAAVPTVTTAVPSSITTSSAVLGGNVTADGGATVTGRGVVYSVTSTNGTPTIGGGSVTQAPNGSGPGTFSATISSLSPGTNYSVRAYATNSAGTSYGATVTFTTAAAVPTVTQLSPTSGPVGTSVVITGTDFAGTTAVSFNGKPTAFTVNSATQITATVAAGTTTGNVIVTTSGGSSAAAAANVFTVILPSTSVSSITTTTTSPTNASSITYTVTFAADVTGLTASNFSLSPTVTGASIGTPTVVSGSSNMQYTVTVNTGTGDGALQLNLVNATGLSRGVSNIPYAVTSITIDKTAPTTTITSSTPGVSNGSTTNTTPIAFAITFPETVLDFRQNDVQVTGGTLTGFFINSASNYTFNVTPSGSGSTVRVNVAANVATDQTGNGNTAATEYSVTYLQPLVANSQPVTVNLAANGTATLNASSVNSNSSGAGTLTYTIQKIVYGRVPENGTLVLSTPNGANFTSIPFASYGTPTNDPNGNYRLGQCDANGQNSTANSVTKAQNAYVNQSSGSLLASNNYSDGSTNFGDPCGGTPKALAVQAAYSADAASLTYDCTEAGKTQYVLLTVSNGTSTSTSVAQVTVNAPPTATISSVSPTSAQRGTAVTVTGTNLSGVTSVTVNGATATVSSLSNGFTFVVPNTATFGPGSLAVATPCAQTLTSTFTVVAPALTATVSTTSTSPTSTAPLPFSVTFSQSVGTTFTASDVTVANGTVASGSFSGSGAGPYAFNVTPAGTGTITVSLAAGVASDANNTGNSASNSVSVQYNQPVTAAPVVTAPANGSLLNTTTPTYQGTAPAGSLVTVYVDNVSIGTTTATASGSFSLAQPTALALAQGSHTVYATAQTSGATVSANSNVNTFNVDSMRPTVTISSSTASGSTTSTTPFLFTVTFSENVTGFSASGVTVTNGTSSGFSGSGATYTFSVTPTTAGTATTVNVAANVATDNAGNGNTAAASAYTLTLGTLTWTGNINSDWFTAGNWSPTQLPSSTLDVVIPTTPSGGRFPFISANSITAAAKNVTIASSASLTMSANTLVVAGNLTNNGTFNSFTGSGSSATGGTVLLGNSTTSNILGASNTRFWNLTVGPNGAQQSTSASTSVQRLLLLNGNFSTNGNSFTLESNANLTAQVTNNNGVVNGNVTVQRYINPSLNPNLGYRHISTAVSGQTVGNLATGSFSPVVNPAYNASAQPGTVTPFPTVYGYDQSRLATATNNLSTFDKGWFSPSALSDALNVGQGYTALIAGGQTWAFTGPLNSGDRTLTLTRNAGATAADAGLSLVGNPYPSPLDWSQVVNSGGLSKVDGALYVFQSNDPTNPYAGQYGVYANGLGISPVLPQGQGFFVRVSQGQTNGTLTFTNAQRPSTYTATTYYRTTAETRPLVQLSLKAAGSATGDDAFVYFEQGSTEGFDSQYDARKMPNPSGLNLSTTVAGEQFSIDGRPAIGTVQRVVPLAVGVPAAGAYSLSPAQLLNLDTTPVYLRDLQTGAVIDLKLQPSYQFTVSNASALITGRFELVFSPQQPLATATAALAQQVALYPNPAKKAAFVELPASLGRQAVTASLVDALGRVVRTVSLPAKGAVAHQLDLSELATGVYALRLSTSAGVLVKKLVIE